MEEDDVIAEIRMKYAEDLEELLQCPICFHRPTGSVPTCAEGHHICSSCQAQLKLCPVCNSQYNGTRNYLAEGLSSKLDDILSSLLDPTHSLNRKVIENKRCIGTQTNASVQSQNGNLTLDKSTIIDENDNRMCRIGFCQSELPSNCMYFHVRDFHKTSLIEVKALYSEFIKYWDLEYSLSKLYNYAINIKDMGLFFFSVYIDENGHLLGNVEIVHSLDLKKQFHYKLIIANRETEKSIGFNRPIWAVPLDKKFAFGCKFYKDLFSSYFQGDTMLLKKELKTFNCHLIISRLLPTENEPESEMS